MGPGRAGLSPRFASAQQGDCGRFPAPLPAPAFSSGTWEKEWCHVTADLVGLIEPGKH